MYAAGASSRAQSAGACYYIESDRALALVYKFTYSNYVVRVCTYVYTCNFEYLSL